MWYIFVFVNLKNFYNESDLKTRKNNMNCFICKGDLENNLIKHDEYQ